MPNRKDRMIEKEKIIKKLIDCGLEKNDIENLSSDKLRKTLHAILKEMKTISKPVKIVIVNTSKNEYDSECSYCDTSDSECEYCDTFSESEESD